METTLVIVNILAVISIGVSGFLVRRLFKEVDKLKEEVGKMKDNYLNRFENVKQHITDKFESVNNKLNENQEKVLEAISNIKLDLEVTKTKQNNRRK